MAVLNALRETPSALRRNPVLFVPVFVLLLFQIPQIVLQAVNPIVASIVSMLLSLVFIVVTPFFQAGVIGMSHEALDGRTSLDTFWAAGKSNYVSVLVAYLALVAVNFFIGLVVFFTALFGGLAIYGSMSGGGGMGIVALAVLGLVVLLFGLAYLVFVFFIQFYGQAIVIDDYGAVDGLKHSVSVVRNNLASTFGYSVLVAVVGGILGAVYGVASFLLSPQSPTGASMQHISPGAAAVLAVVLLAAGTLFGGFFGVYSVAFYEAIAPSDASANENGGENGGVGAASAATDATE